MRKIKKALKQNKLIFNSYMRLQYVNSFISYKFYPIKAIEKKYRQTLNRELSLNNPKSLNEKIQYMNLYKRHELSSICADKYGVRDFIEKHGYKHLLVNLIGVYENTNDIDFDMLPEKFALKCTHGSGYNIICKDKSKLNVENTKKKLNKWMKQNYAIKTLEMHYKDIKPRIICEEYINGFENELPIDYKVFCFNGKPQFIECCIGRESNLKMVFYDTEWNKLPYSTSEGQENINIEKPLRLEEMLKAATDLSESFDFVRVDFFESEGKLLFGELTFTPAGGLMKSMTEEADRLWGDLLEI